MNALKRFLAVGFSGLMALMLAGCEVTIGESSDDDDHNNDPMEVGFDGSSQESDFNFSQRYLFTLTGDSNKITL